MAILLQVSNLSKTYDVEPLFADLSLTIASGQHIGVIGRNGAGKSTLFRIILGLEEADSGEVQIHADTRIGYIRQQEDPFDPSESVIDFLMRSSGKESWECGIMAAKFHIKNDDLERAIGSFSGGYQMRIKIIDILLKDPNLLFLDEPTNYLDLSTLLLLEQFLRDYTGSFLLISHDREFLKRTCEQTIEIAHKKATHYKGPLEDYLAYKETQEEFARRYNKKVAKEQRHLQAFVDRFRYKSSKASQAQSKLKQLKKLKTITIEHAMKTARIHLPHIAEKKGIALTTATLAIGYPDRTVASNISFTIDRGEKVAIVGNNGQGKTTLLKTLAGVLPALSGTLKWGHTLKVGYYAQHVPDMLVPSEQVGTYLERMGGAGYTQQELLQMAGNFLFSQDDLKKSISVLSGGEKARVCLAGLLLEKHDVLLLDEPTNHLDVETVEALAEALAATNMTILFVSHNRTFVQTIATSIIEVGGGMVRRSYHDYENYIWHLKESLDIGNEREEEKTVDEKKEERARLHETLKQEKKKLQEIEHQTMELEKQKQDLYAWFEEHPTTFSRLKQDELDVVSYELDAVERSWLETQETIEKMEGRMGTLRG